MITADFYETTTGTEAPADLADQVAHVVARLETALNRPLGYAVRTEWVEVYPDGTCFPQATPVATSLDGRAVSDIEFRVTTGWPRQGTDTRTKITYEGGYVPQGEDMPVVDGVALDETYRVPAGLAQAIAWGVHTLANPTDISEQIPAGVKAMSVAGEFSVTLDDTAGADGRTLPAGFGSLRDLGGRCATLAAPYARVAAGA